MKIKKRKSQNLFEIEILREWFGLEKKNLKGLIGFFHLKKAKNEIDFNIKSLCQQAGIQKPKDFTCSYINPNKNCLFECLTTENSVYRLIFHKGFYEDYPTLEIKNERLQAQYDYIEDNNFKWLTLTQLSYQSDNSLLKIGNSELKTPSKDKMIDITIDSLNNHYQIQYQKEKYLPNVAISNIEKVLKKLEELKENDILAVLKIISQLFPSFISNLKEATIDVKMGDLKLHLTIKEGKIEEFWTNNLQMFILIDQKRKRRKN